ncbi:MAG: DUF2254 domain-containing protein [Actinomycetia bacterium]|nr:DUF2254 domain-containing protein [Actinomycetes bacterium]
MLRKLILRYKESIWFIPSLCILGSIVLAFITTVVDNTFQPQLRQFLPAFAFTSVNLGRDILTVIATSLLTMTTITFSTIMVVLSIYSSQFSPRTLQNFISDRLTQIVLGVFIAGFTYAVVSLLFMHEREPETLVFSAFFAIILALISIGYFIRFIQYITSSIQVNNLMEKLSQEVLQILKRKKRTIQDMKKNGKVLSNVKPGIINLHKRNHIEIKARLYGHIQYIDIEGLMRFAREHNVLVETTVKIGDYVGKSTIVLLIWNHDMEKELKCNVSKYFSLGNYKSTSQDLDFGIQKIEEIALRAISPGINDPNTAMLGVRNMAVVMSEINHYCAGKKYFYDQKQNLRLILDERNYEEILYASFYKILNFSRNQISLFSTILEAISIIAENRDRRSRDTLYEFCKYTINGFNHQILQKKDRYFLNIKLEKIAKHLKVEPKKLLLS